MCKKLGLEKVIRYSLLIGGGVYVILFGMHLIFDVHPLIHSVISGLGMGFGMVSIQMQWGLVGEAIDYNEYLTGKRSEGAIYGTFSLTRRIGQTLSASLAVLMISWFGYIAHDPEVPVVQPGEAIMGIKLMCILIPAIIAMGSWFAFRVIWNITPEKRAAMAEWKAQRAAAATAEVEKTSAEA
jgi:Na+/melibiose symporter-like transporter